MINTTIRDLYIVVHLYRKDSLVRIWITGNFFYLVTWVR